MSNQAKPFDRTTAYNHLAVIRRDAGICGFEMGVTTVKNWLGEQAAKKFLEGSDKEAMALRKLSVSLAANIRSPESKPTDEMIEEAEEYLLREPCEEG